MQRDPMFLIHGSFMSFVFIRVISTAVVAGLAGAAVGRPRPVAGRHRRALSRRKCAADPARVRRAAVVAESRARHGRHRTKCRVHPRPDAGRGCHHRAPARRGCAAGRLWHTDRAGRDPNARHLRALRRTTGRSEGVAASAVRAHVVYGGGRGRRQAAPAAEGRAKKRSIPNGASTRARPATTRRRSPRS